MATIALSDCDYCYAKDGEAHDFACVYAGVSRAVRFRIATLKAELAKMRAVVQAAKELMNGSVRITETEDGTCLIVPAELLQPLGIAMDDLDKDQEPTDDNVSG